MYYYFFKIDEWCKNHVRVGNFASVDMPALKKVPFPLPSLSEQRRIVGILDRFEALCGDLSAGLPAEIAARQKQYAYYREQLLSFEPLVEEGA